MGFDKNVGGRRMNATMVVYCSECKATSTEWFVCGCVEEEE